MLDKFLNKINNSSVNSSINKKIADYNKEVLETKKIEPTEEFLPTMAQIYQPNKFQKYSKFEKTGSGFSRPNTYQTFENKEKKQYIDDGSYFCSYAIGGTTLVCYKDKDKVELVLDKIFHPDKNNYLSKRANYFLNDLVKKKKVYIEEMDNGKYEIFLDPNKKESINTLLINEGFDNSESKKSSGDEKNIKKDDKEDKDSTVDVVKKEKINYAYGLFAKDHNTFEALFDKNKITLKLADLNLDLISKEDQKICKSMIYEFVSKKNIILKFVKEENGIHFARVSNKEGECLNDLMSAKKFKILNNDSDDNNSNQNNEENCSEEDWNFASSKKKETDNHNEEQDVPEITVLPAMFKKSFESKPNSPFAKKKPIEEVVKPSIQNLEEEQDVPEITVLPAMFKKPLESKPNSPFAKKIVLQNENNEIKIESEVVTIKKKLSFGKR